MPYRGLSGFISQLEKDSELIRITSFVNPVLEIAEITDRVTKNNGKALLFENNGTRFPVLINIFGSDKRLDKALGTNDLASISEELMDIFNKFTGMPHDFTGRIRNIPKLFSLIKCLPSRSKRKGKCQEIIIPDPDLSIFPVLKCWPHDGGRFITLPMVHTIHPETGKTNLGMYRMQVFDNKTTGMHWQRHKTGANHFEAWKKTGRRMPVTVTLGGDPVYTYAATAPLPENIDEYLLAGFLRKKGVNLVKCITNDLYVPDDADIVIEGYVDTAEKLAWEGPFGDHTGFYSLADWYPRFHVTCITHSRDAVYPATIVGIPPQEDAWIAKATERIFLAPVKLTLQPEISDFHMPDAGVAHNLAIIKLHKSYPGQGKKVLSSLMGAGQMMFTKYMIAVSGEVDIRNYMDLSEYIFRNSSFKRDFIQITGPLDVLDHSSDSFSYGGKAGLDATIKMEEELQIEALTENGRQLAIPDTELETLGKEFNIYKIPTFPVYIVGADQQNDNSSIKKIVSKLETFSDTGMCSVFIVVDKQLQPDDLYTVIWQVLGNSDPVRDMSFINNSILFVDGTSKVYSKNGFKRSWPNIVSSSIETINKVDQIWNDLGISEFMKSPSLKYIQLSSRSNNEFLKPDGKS